MSNIVIVDHNVKDIEVLKQSFKNTFTLITYDHNANINDIINNVTDNTTHLTFIWFNNSNSYRKSIPFFEDTIDANLIQNGDFQLINDKICSNKLKNLFQHINNLINVKLTVDLLTCDLNDEYFTNEVNEIEESLNINIRYSIDKTGNIGNWVLESNNVDIKDFYFNDFINHWNHVLDYEGVSINNVTKSTLNNLQTTDGAGTLSLSTGKPVNIPNNPDFLVDEEFINLLKYLHSGDKNDGTANIYTTWNMHYDVNIYRFYKHTTNVIYDSNISANRQFSFVAYWDKSRNAGNYYLETGFWLNDEQTDWKRANVSYSGVTSNPGNYLRSWISNSSYDLSNLDNTMKNTHGATILYKTPSNFNSSSFYHVINELSSNTSHHLVNRGFFHFNYKIVNNNLIGENVDLSGASLTSITDYNQAKTNNLINVPELHSNYNAINLPISPPSNVAIDITAWGYTGSQYVAISMNWKIEFYDKTDYANDSTIDPEITYTFGNSANSWGGDDWYTQVNLIFKAKEYTIKFNTDGDDISLTADWGTGSSYNIRDNIGFRLRLNGSSSNLYIVMRNIYTQEINFDLSSYDTNSDIANRKTIIGPNVNLSGVDLSNSNMRYFNLRNTDFTGTDLSGSNLTNADLSGTIFNNTTLTNSNLSNVQNIQYSISSNLTNVSGIVLYSNVSITNNAFDVTEETPEEIPSTSSYTEEQVTNFVENSIGTVAQIQSMSTNELRDKRISELRRLVTTKEKTAQINANNLFNSNEIANNGIKTNTIIKVIKADNSSISEAITNKISMNNSENNTGLEVVYAPLNNVGDFIALDLTDTISVVFEKYQVNPDNRYRIYENGSSTATQTNFTEGDTYQIDIGNNGTSTFNFGSVLIVNNIPITITASALIDIDVSLNDISGIFQFYTDISNVNNLNIDNSDISFNCNSGNWVDISYSYNKVTINKIGPYLNNEGHNDIIRHLSQKIFGSYVGVDIFTNNSVMKNELKELDNTINTMIKNKLQSSDNLDNTTQTSQNLSRELLKILLEHDNSRIQTILTNQFNDNDTTMKNIPLEVGDNISFKVNYEFKDISNLNLGINFPEKKDYIIRLNIK